MRHLNKLLLAIFLLAAVNFTVQAAEETSPDEAITACCKLDIDNSERPDSPKLMKISNSPLPDGQAVEIPADVGAGNSPQ